MTVDSPYDRILFLPSGQRLGFACYGLPGGRPAFYFHGTPGSRREGGLLHRACVDAGIELIAPDRPGYGLSQAVSGDRHRLWADAVAALADHLEFDHFYIYAVSGGGPYALACASLLRPRVVATSISCGLGDVTQAGLRADMGVIARTALLLADIHPQLLKQSYGSVSTFAARYFPRLAVEAVRWFNRRVDRVALQPPPIKALFADNLREAFHQGAVGGVDDICAALTGWSFELSVIQSLQLWHGTRDSVVPLCHSEWLAEQIPSARLEVVEGEGHFSLPVTRADTIVRELTDKFPL